MEKNYSGEILTDSLSLYEHIIAFKDAEEGYADSEFCIIINYDNTEDLIELVEHLKDFYGDYDGDGWVATVMGYIWDEGFSITTEEQEKIHQNAYDYWKEKIDKK
ncbi:MAG: hypothetical protein ACOYLT_10620 [Flavobacterium sp.]|jgi:hypothetical protein|uniref:hypothetical protein n=1 Tax=Flavobacterium sp. TaxID=239 RepID=UPI003BD05A4A